MLLDLTDVLFQDGKVLERSLSLEMDRFSIRTGSFPLRVRTPLQLTVVNAGEKVLDIEGHVELTAAIPCARCLSPVEVDFALDIQRRVDMKMTPQEREEALEETNFIEDGALVPETLVRNELLVQWPVRVLCREDCKGICSQCGANLNEGPCGCQEPDPDPRMAAIRDIFSKFKEV